MKCEHWYSDTKVAGATQSWQWEEEEEWEAEGQGVVVSAVVVVVNGGNGVSFVYTSYPF